MGLTQGTSLVSYRSENKRRQCSPARKADPHLGDPGLIRTGDLRFRKPPLYPPELRGRWTGPTCSMKWFPGRAGLPRPRHVPFKSDAEPTMQTEKLARNARVGQNCVIRPSHDKLLGVRQSGGRRHDPCLGRTSGGSPLGRCSRLPAPGPSCCGTAPPSAHATDEAGSPGFQGFSTRPFSNTPAPPPPPETAEQVAQDVEASMMRWRVAILNKDAQAVIGLDMDFKQRPGPLSRSAGEERAGRRERAGPGVLDPRHRQDEEPRRGSAVQTLAGRCQPVRSPERRLGAGRAARRRGRSPWPSCAAPARVTRRRRFVPRPRTRSARSNRSVPTVAQKTPRKPARPGAGKRAWQRPQIKSGRLFESNSLACGKNGPGMENCEQFPKIS